MGACGHRRAKNGEKLGNEGGWRPLPRVEGDPALAIADYPAAGQVERPDRPKLADVLGPGLITGASDDDPERDRDLRPSGRRFRLRSVLDAPSHLPAHVRDPDDQRRDRLCDGQGHRRQYATLLSSVSALCAGRLARPRQRHQYRRRPWSDGSGVATHSARTAMALCGGVRYSHCAPRSVHALRELCLRAALADPLAVRLCRHGVRRRRAMGNGRLPSCRSACRVDGGLFHHRCGNLRHHDQPLSFLLAGFRRGRRRGGRSRRGAASEGAGAGARQIGAYGSTRSLAWAYPIWSRFSSC